MDILKFATFKTFPMFDCFSNFPQWVGNDKKGIFSVVKVFKKTIHSSIYFKRKAAQLLFPFSCSTLRNSKFELGNCIFQESKSFVSISIFPTVASILSLCFDTFTLTSSQRNTPKGLPSIIKGFPYITCMRNESCLKDQTSKHTM